MRISTIDIGTNTILMLIAEPDPKTGQVRTIRDILSIPRLGKGVDSNRNITPASFEKAAVILKEYKMISDESKSSKVIAAATSFIRDSANRNEFISKIKDETGIEIEILSGSDEARWTFWGGTYDKYQRTKDDAHGVAGKEQICAIDIGGGSTEIVSSRNLTGKIDKNVLFNHPVNSISIDIGSVRIKERFFTSHPPGAQQLSAAELYINDELDRTPLKAILQKGGSGISLIGVAGTITTLGALKTRLDRYDAEKVDGLIITSDDVNNVLEQMRGMKLEQLYAMGDYMEGRADVIIPGLLILKCFMVMYGFDELTISTKGLRYGLFLREVYK